RASVRAALRLVRDWPTIGGAVRRCRGPGNAAEPGAAVVCIASIISTAESSAATKTAITVVIPALNEEVNLPAALASVSWAEQIVVVDSHSSDRTAVIAREGGAEVLQFDHRGRGPKKKAWALAHAPVRHEWVLVLDADERVTRELR